MTPSRPFLFLVALLTVLGFVLWLTGCATTTTDHGPRTTGERDRLQFAANQPKRTEARLATPFVFPRSVEPDAEVIGVPWPVLIITNTISYTDVITGACRFTGCEIGGVQKALVRVPEPTGQVAIMGKFTNGTSVWWQPVGWSNLTQRVSVTFTNVSNTGEFTKLRMFHR